MSTSCPQKKTEYLIRTYPNIKCPQIMTIIEQRFRGLTEAASLASTLARHAPNRSMATMGLNEMFVNAIEHGNLGIEYNTKATFLNESQWFEEINKRLLEKANIHKYVKVITEITPHYVKFTIIDQGRGFDFQKYQQLKTVPISNCNGRGILISKEAVFNTLIYYAPGNRVDCIIYK